MLIFTWEKSYHQSYKGIFLWESQFSGTDKSLIALFCSTDKAIEINVLEILKISFISHWYFYLIKTETYKI